VRRNNIYKKDYQQLLEVRKINLHVAKEELELFLVK